VFQPTSILLPIDWERRWRAKAFRDVAQTLSNLGILYRNQGKYAEAEAHYKRAPGDL
jgi:tetratricopeptide (TPR) repeat protein